MHVDIDICELCVLVLMLQVFHMYCANSDKKVISESEYFNVRVGWQYLILWY